MSALDKQVGGDHYKKLKIQPIEYIQANDLGFEEGNAIKYITRHAFKGGAQDLDKAIHYLELLKARRYPPLNAAAGSLFPVQVVRGSSLEQAIKDAVQAPPMKRKCIWVWMDEDGPDMVCGRCGLMRKEH